MPGGQTGLCAFAQAWMALSNLLLDAGCRAKYDLDDFRVETLLNLRPSLSGVSLRELPTGEVIFVCAH